MRLLLSFMLRVIKAAGGAVVVEGLVRFLDLDALELLRQFAPV